MRSRESGILMAISSLPGKYGIGDFGAEAYSFIDFLTRAGQKNWQILPLGITGYGDSPYQSFSAFAGNPYFIDIDELIELGLLKKADVAFVNFGEANQVDYGKIYVEKYKLLRKAYDNIDDKLKSVLVNFYRENSWWLREFALFMAIKDQHNGLEWINWDEDYIDYDSKVVKNFEENNEKAVYFWVFTQYLFTKQWKRLKEYANSKGIKIIGDIPIYVSIDSSDLWANPKLFLLDEKFLPTVVSGVPPDAFTSKGQLWGNPVYNWDRMELEGYDFWIKRIKKSTELFDTIRIDHFRGFESFWGIPYGSKDAINGKWIKGPGMKIFERIKDVFGEVDIIAEDLGFKTEEVVELMKATGFPGMKVLQFAFDPNSESDYLPHNCERNSVVYTGTHDNSTVRDWFDSADEEVRNFAVEYLRLNEVEGINWGIIRGAWSASSYLAIAQIQDFLNLGGESRMNTPSTLGGNWTWRVDSEYLTEELADRIRNITKIYRRCANVES